MELIRIVRMTFREDKISDFTAIFDASKGKIRAMPGCKHVELFQDYNQPHIFTTYSIWENEDFLNQYRASALFEEVWKNTKALFADKPIAFSLKKTS